MNKQRKVVITTTYNEMGIIIDTKAEEVAQPNLQPTCNQLAKDICVPCKDTISRQEAIDALDTIESEVADGEGFRYAKWREYFENLPSAQPEQRVEELLPDGTLHLFTDTDLSKVNRVWVSQNNTHYGDLYYADEDPKRGKWIPCSERLPEEDGQYLITEKGTFGDYLYVGIANYGVPCMPMNKGQGRGWYITDSEGDYYCGMDHVLAWMPLPEPYREEGEK